MGKLAWWIVGLAAWYAMTGQPDVKTSIEKYPLADSISVIDASYKSKRTGGQILSIKSSNDDFAEKRLAVRDIDFSENFNIVAKRYTLDKDEDFFLTRWIGHAASLPGKLLFWDWDYGFGPDAEKSRTTLAILEENKEMNGMTVRLGHNRVWHDAYRLFADDKVTERNNILARATLGLYSVFGGELFAEMSRGNYYNPMTQTVVAYANIESVIGHEIGHHQDFQRFNQDWIYQLARILPPVMLYQEWVASTNAEKLMSKEDKYQYKRYLLPAFMTYLVGTYAALKKKFGKKDGRKRKSTTSA